MKSLSNFQLLNCTLFGRVNPSEWKFCQIFRLLPPQLHFCWLLPLIIIMSENLPPAAWESFSLCRALQFSKHKAKVPKKKCRFPGGSREQSNVSWRNIVEKHDKGMVIALFNRHLFVYGLELSNMKSCTLGKSGAAHSSQMCLAWRNLVERQKAWQRQKAQPNPAVGLLKLSNVSVKTAK